MADLVERQSKGPKKQASSVLGLSACVAGYGCRGVFERRIGSQETSSFRLVLIRSPSVVRHLACLGRCRVGSPEASSPRGLDWFSRVSLDSALRFLPLAGTGLAMGRI